MNSPIGQRTLLSIAVAASLACISGGNALADGSITYCVDGVCTDYTHTNVTDNLILYDPDPYATNEKGEVVTVPTILTTLPESGEIILTIEGTSESAFEDITGTVYGIAAAGTDIIESKANLTINVTNAEIDGKGEWSHRGGKPDSVLYGVYAAGSSKVTFGDVTINITNSILGSSTDGYNDVVIGARDSDDASLTVGNVTIIVDDEADGEEYSRIFGVRHNSNGTITTDNIYVEVKGNAEGGRVEGYIQENFEGIHPTGDANIGDVTVKIEGVATTDPSTGETTYSTFDGYAHGCNLNWMVPEVTIGNIVLELSNITMVQETESEFVGLNTKDNANEMPDAEYGDEVDIYSTVVTAESVSVKAKNINDPKTGSFRAIEKFDAGTVTVTGNVSLAADTMTTASHSIDAISVGAGTLVVGGNTSMYVKDVNSLNIYAFRAGHESYSPDPSSAGQYADISATLENIDLVYVSTDSDYKITNNIYGVATEIVEDADAGHTYVQTIKTGDVSVTIAGSAEAMGFDNTVEDSGFNSIYGTVQGSGTIDHGTRTLVFGYVGDDIDGNESNVPFTSDGTNYSFNATFSNFDEVVVKSGSELYITSSQKGFNFEDNCGSFFSTGDEADDGHSLWSEDGVLYLVETSGLTIEEGGLADIMIVVNNGAIEVDGALTTYTSSEEFLIIEGDEQTDITCTSGNAGAISGTGTLTIAKGTLDSFENTGTISVSTLDVAESVNLTNTDTGTINTETINLAENSTLTNSENGSFTSQAVNVAAGAILSGPGDMTVVETTVASGGTIATTGNFTFNDGAGTGSVSNSGTITVDGTANFDGTAVENSSIINVASLEAEGATYTQTTGGITTVSGTANFDGAVIENSGEITVETLQADGATYNQTGGSITVTDGSWFTSSDITISDSTLERDDLGQSNNYTINDSGVLTVSEVTSASGSTVTINEGGQLNVTALFQDGTPSDTVITLAGGALITTPDQIFSDTITAILMDESGTAEIPVESDIFVGNVLDSVKSGFVIESGEIGLVTDYYSESMVQSAIDNFQSAGFDTSSLTISFSGELIINDVFTVNVANELIKGGEPASTPGIILNTVTLVGLDSSLTVGGSDESSTNILSPGMGFMNVSGVEDVTVNEGTFVLVGEVGGDYNSDKLLLDAGDDGGTVTVKDGATFTLGTLGATNASGGWIGSTDIEAGASFNVKNGEFADWTITNEGTITIDATGILHTSSLTGEAGAITNSGKLYIEADSEGNAEFTVGTGGLVNSGVLTASDVATTFVTGELTNSGSMSTGDVVVSARTVNEESGSWTILGKLVVSGSEDEGFTNEGELSAYELGIDSDSIVANSIAGNLTVSGDVSNSGTIENLGTVAIDGTLTLEDGGAIINAATDENASSMTIGALDAQEGSLIGNDENASIILLGSSTIAGEIQSFGTVSTADIEISGTAINDGSWTTEGTLTSSGSVSNSGDMSAYGLVVADGATLMNSGSLTVTDEEGTGASSSISGTLSNTGNISIDTDLTVDGSIVNDEDAALDMTGTTTVSGTVRNFGAVGTADVEISGSVENNSTASWTTTGTMTVSGSVSNYEGGDISADALTMTESSSTLSNQGTFTVAGDSSIAGTVTNTGEFTASGDVTLSGTIINSGTEENTAVMTLSTLSADRSSVILNSEQGSLVLEDTSTLAGTVANQGSVSTADVEISGTVTNQDDAAWTTTGAMTVSGGTVTNYGDLSADTLTLSGSNPKVVTTENLTVSDTLTIDSGSLDIQSGTFTSGSNELSGGTVSLGSSSAASVELGTPSGDIGSQISVLNGSRLSIGSSEYGLDWADSETGSSVGNLLVVSAPITTTDTGGISVGAESSGAGLYFSADSTLVINVDTLGGGAAFTTTSGATATVESGATLVLGGTFDKGSSYSILEGYTTSIAENSWGFDTDNSRYIYGEDNNGLEWSLHLVVEDGKVYVQAVEHEDVSEAFGEDLADPNLANDAFDHCSSDPGSSLICGVLTDESLTKDEQQRTINSITEIAFAGGVMATTMTDVTAAVDSVHNHLTMDGDAFGKDGNLWPWDRNSNLWIDILGSWQHGKHLKATSISNYKYRTNSYGFILGYDYKLPDTPVVLGAAFSFSDGDLKSKGGVSKTKNDYQTYGVSLYGNYSPSPYYNIIGSVHWFHNSADIKQYTSSGKATAKIQTNLIAVGLRGETTIKAGQVNFVPHAEARYIYGKSGKYTTKLSGEGLWNTKADGTHTVQFPVGLAARTDIKTESGWNIRPKADISVIPQVGSTKQKSVVRAHDGVTDTVEGQFMGKFGGSVKVGLQADKGNATVGLRYGFLGGTKGRADHSVMLQGRLRF